MQTKKNEEKKSKQMEVGDFIQRNRKAIFTTLIIIAVLFIASIVTVYIWRYNAEKSILAVEELNIRFEELHDSLLEIYSDEDIDEEINIDDTDDDIEDEEAQEAQQAKKDKLEEDAQRINVLLADIETFAANYSGYAGARAYWLIGRIYTVMKEWEKAENAWVSSAKKSENTYLNPLAWFNAGVSAEQHGDYVSAIEHYSNSLLAQDGFPDDHRAWFSMGRLLEAVGDYEGAIEVYNNFIDLSKYDTPWINLAHSRIIALEILISTTENETNVEIENEDD